MRLTAIMSEDLVLPDLQARQRDEALEELINELAAREPAIDAPGAVAVLIARERMGSTGVGHGFAIPHGKLPDLPAPMACFARSASGVDFGSLDGEPAHLFLALLAPEGAAGFHLKALARATRLFKDHAFRDALRGAPDRGTLWRLLVDQDQRLSEDEGPRG